jgi:hypothetical protein
MPRTRCCTQTQHGFASLFPMPGQGLGVVFGRLMADGSRFGRVKVAKGPISEAVRAVSG